jgi:hypothetical protein
MPSPDNRATMELKRYNLKVEASSNKPALASFRCNPDAIRFDNRLWTAESSTPARAYFAKNIPRFCVI